MSKIVAMVSALDVDTANADAHDLGLGPKAFNVPVMRDGVVTHFAMHHWYDLPELAQISVPVDVQSGEAQTFHAAAEMRGVTHPDETLAIPWPPAQDWLQNLPMAGDVQTFDGVEYRSLIDNNVWSPDAYPQGWELVEQVTGPQPWVQPTGSHDAYQTGDEVTHPNAQDNDNVWLFRSKIDANTAEPGTDGAFHRWWEPLEITT